MTDRITTGLRGAGDRLHGTAKVFQGFKDFISRGNAIELAVGVVIGAAFGAVVSSIVNGLIGPLIAAIFGKGDLSNTFSWTWNGSHFSIGLILQALILFLITAASVYFLVVLPLNALANRRKQGLEEEPTAPAEDILLLQEIRDLLAARPSRAVTNDAAPDSPGARGPVPPSAPPSS
ncbi:large conductance mechanosensitive channel protein MscL [Cellulomonas sp. URHE0023]|uniref:large conductance mechanosensitive channel protein MscL n=1 Tax=Cellulomonas sp. URHE0023 TaxID=1380354 RepID=UPI0009DCD1A1|nr:large conductance mechanosensitive channel protein MscL [Cellulomonas sp. URHE0023]